jgi:hypothetical protein
VTVGSKEKETQSPQVLIRNPTPEAKEILKSSPPFSFENEIQKIKIPVPFLELIKMKNLKNISPKCYSLNLLQVPLIQ